MIVVTATAAIPMLSRKISTPCSLTATELTAPLVRSARPRAARRLIAATSKIPSTSSSATPMNEPSRCQRPFHRGAVTAPRRPASPRMISSVSGSTRTSQSGARAGRPPGLGVPTASDGAVRGWRLVIASF
ncbi:MAG: hypothetical protein M3Z75_05840 [Actinomycetota bacterium]|nr:hypothetical protein [Actinomycetota bacterium]